MRDTVSIIFAAIFMVLVIVILPLFSILDRQDNISYNVVLTQTTKFVDEIRANGFLTEDAYETFISSLASTGNTYKVTLEAYKHSLIPETKEDGTVIPDSYIDELELYNTQDIVDYLTGNKVNVEAENSNRKENVYLFEKSDEIYVRVYNTNITAGSVMYNMLMGAVETKVIDITYGGAVNNVNWELYTKIKMETIATPEVTLSVPVNMNNNINVSKLVTDEELKSVECIVEDYGGLFADAYEMCTDVGKDDIYKYIYDLDEVDEDSGEYVNQTITVAARFTDVAQIKVRETNDLEYVFGDVFGGILDIFDLASYEDWDYLVSNNVFDTTSTYFKNMEKYIIENYIRLNGMTADIDLTRVGVGDYHDFNIVLTNVKMATTGAISEVASIAVLAGLGRNEYHDLTVGDETIQFELTNKTEARTTAILGPYNWKQYLKTKVADAAAIATDPKMVYRNQEIFFKIQYTGIKDLNPDQVVERLKTGLSFNRDSGTNYSETASLAVTYYTPLQMLNEFGLTVEMDTIIVKFSYTSSHLMAGNRYLNLGIDWYPGMDQVKSETFILDRDTYVPKAPAIDFEGEKGENGWFVSDVEVKVASNGDRTQSSGVSGRTGTVSSGVYRSTVTLSGSQTLEETDADNGIIITADSVNGVPTTVLVKTEDYAGNVYTSPTQEVYVDKVKPSEPIVTISPSVPASGWYTTDVYVTVDISSTGRVDKESGINRTTYTIEGANAQVETTYTGRITLKDSGISRVTIKHYDNAGNTSTAIHEIKIDKGEPAMVEFENINGLKRNEETEWYFTDVETRITVLYTGSTSQVKKSHYEVIGADGTVITPKTEFTEETKDIVLSGNNIHTINVYTSTTGGVEAKYTHVVKIDEDAPAMPTITINEEKGSFDDGTNVTEWYITDVNVIVTLNEDVGHSGVTDFTYSTKFGEEEAVEVTGNASGTVITLSREGSTLLKITATDAAGNSVVYEEVIKIDKTAPTPATIVIDGLQEEGNEWYHSELYISYVDAADDISGISKVEIAQYEGNDESGWTQISTGVWDITATTISRKIVLTTYNGAAIPATTEKIIKMDNKAPTEPVINVAVADGTKTYSSGGIFMSGGPVTINITPGVETVDGGKESGQGDTYYRVEESGDYDADDKAEDKSNIVGTEVTIEGREGEDIYYVVVAGTKDVAGNATEVTKVIRICRAAPTAPTIVAINGQSVDSYTITGTSSTASLDIIGTNGISIDVYVAGSLVNTITNDGVTYVNSISVGTTFAEGVETTIYIKQTSLFGIESPASNVVTYKYTTETEGGDG